MKHLRNLTNKQILRWLDEIEAGNVTATVKEDGYAMTVGVDADGRPFVSRMGKEGNPARYFSVDEIPEILPNTSLLIGAQIWLDSSVRSLTMGFAPNEEWNVELVYPEFNIINYDSVELIFIEQLSGDIKRPKDELINRLIDCAIKRPRANQDGYYDWIKERVNEILFRPTTNIVCSHIFEDMIADYSVSNPNNRRNFLNIRLNCVPHDDIPALRAVRDVTKALLIAELDEIARTFPGEGIVLRSDILGTVKIVPRSFTAANIKAHAVRNALHCRTFDRSFLHHLPFMNWDDVCRIRDGWKHVFECGRLWHEDYDPDIVTQLRNDVTQLYSEVCRAHKLTGDPMWMNRNTELEFMYYFRILRGLL